MFTALTALLTITGLLFVVGGVVAVVGMRNAPEGYENEEGFHFGRNPLQPLPTQQSWREYGARLAEQEPAAVPMQKAVGASDHEWVA